MIVLYPTEWKNYLQEEKVPVQYHAVWFQHFSWIHIRNSAAVKTKTEKHHDHNGNPPTFQKLNP